MFEFDVQESGNQSKQCFADGSASGFGWLTCPDFAFDKSKPKSVPNSMGQRVMPDSVCFRWCNFENDQQATPSPVDLFMLNESGLVSHPNFEMRSETALV